MTIDEAIIKHIQKADSYHKAMPNYYEAAEHRQLAEWLNEYKEAKRLLKAAVDDFSNMYDHIFDCDGMCDTCPIHGNRDTCDKWVRADEALKLIGEGGDT